MIDSKYLIANIDDTCDTVYRKMADSTLHKLFRGMAVVVNNDDVVQGVITDGDFRRAYNKNISFSNKIVSIMNANPFYLTIEQVESDGIEIYKNWSQQHKKTIQFVVVVDEKNKLKNVISIQEMLAKVKSHITLIGMGFVGITLAAHILNEGQNVLAIEKNHNIIKDLQNGIASHVFEPGLEAILKKALESGRLKCNLKITNTESNIYIIAVGTPVDSKGIVNTTAIEEACKNIGNWLKKEDHVMIRSTVPVGTTRSVITKILETSSGLSGGTDFSVSFVPERTAEGAALEELKSLPQIIGSLTNACHEKAIKFWNNICPSLVSMKSLEAAELVKLSNNTFRDLSFAFANELSFLADKFNVNAFELITAANEGYPRNKISKPSPGVGGYCLTKDPLLYNNSFTENRNDTTFGFQSRQINQKAQEYPLQVINEFCKAHKLKLKYLKILIVGMAFKGEPETNDMRGSVSVDLLNNLLPLVKQVWIFDWVISKKELKKLNDNVVDQLEQQINDFDIILIMNNHKKNIIIETLISNEKNKILFDGWHQINEALFKSQNNISYATLGYNTLRK